VLPSVQGQIYIDLKGTKTLRLLERKEMKISDASSEQPGYLNVEKEYDGDRAMIDPSDKEIKELAEKIKREANSDDAWTVANSIYVWVKTNTLYHTDLNSDYIQSAIEVLHNRRGDCDELSFLYISLCRAVGIPARFVSGYWVMNKYDEKYVGHAWAEFYYGEWAPVEITELWNSDSETIQPVDNFMINRDNAIFFAIDRPDHITKFVDDGTRESMESSSIISNYYGQRPSFSPYLYYDGKAKNQTYVAYCADGTRRETEKVE
jgi:transglutaminase-like putative cysteine protease